MFLQKPFPNISIAKEINNAWKTEINGNCISFTQDRTFAKPKLLPFPVKILYTANVPAQFIYCKSFSPRQFTCKLQDIKSWELKRIWRCFATETEHDWTLAHFRILPCGCTGMSIATRNTSVKLKYVPPQAYEVSLWGTAWIPCQESRQTDRLILLPVRWSLVLGKKNKQIDYKVASHLEDGALFLLGFPQEGILL